LSGIVVSVTSEIVAALFSAAVALVTQVADKIGINERQFISSPILLIFAVLIIEDNEFCGFASERLTI
jgi:hypothetical protein